MKATAVVAILSLTLGAHLPAPAPASPVVGAFFALSVPDLAASTRWYTRTLGLRVTRDLPEAGVTILERDGLIIELIRHPPAPPAGAPSKTGVPVGGIAKAGFIVTSLDSLLTGVRTENAEIAFGPYPARPGQLANVILRDNAGNLIQIFGR